MTRSGHVTPWLLAVLLLPAAAGAEDRARTEPVSLRATRIEIDQRQGVTRYLGKVDLRQGELRITAARAETRSTGTSLSQVTAEGNPLTFRDLPPGQEAPVEGRAQRLVYEAEAQQAHLSGEVEIRQNRDELRAGIVNYDMVNGLVQAERDETRRPYAMIAPHRQADGAPVEQP